MTFKSASGIFDRLDTIKPKRDLVLNVKMFLRPVILVLVILWFASTALAATTVDTTITKERVAPRRSFGATLAQSPTLIVELPLKAIEELTKETVELAYSQKTPVIFLFKLFGTNKPLHPLLSYGSKPSLEGGLGLRLRDLVSPHDQVRAKALYSVNEYQYYHLGYEGPQLLAPRAGFSLDADYSWMPRESLFGPGNDSPESHEVSVTMETGAIETGLAWAPRDHVGLLFTGGYRSYSVYDGEENELITDLDSSAVTLGMSPASFRSGRFAFVQTRVQLDWRDHRGRPTKGGTQQLSAGYHHGTGRTDDLTFWEARADLWQYFHLFRKRSLAFRFLVESIDILNNKDDLGMPYYLLPTLGGEDDLRGYKRNRFFGRGLALATLEYRFPVLRQADGFVFMDQGRVFGSMREDFTFKAWRYTYGFGVRVWHPFGEIARFTLARSKEESRFYFSFGEVL